ncbi:hypothetical protein K7432_018330 [Basidiobolus ranarum]|uniref:Carrier domain-containing protein n=1 Tax=Basidiobolus ranarum TaxID=34480 RepID=A0ABR2VJ49_9FUNG
MPTNVSGKTDRKSLLKLVENMGMDDLYRFGKRGGDRSLSHFSDTEKAWLSLWVSVLGLAPEFIGRTDSFFSVGGDSIVAIKLVAAAREDGYNITVQQVFDFPTIAELAKQFSTTEDVQSDIEEIERYSLLRLSQDEVETLLYREIQKSIISSTNIEDVYPCAPLQEALFAIGLREKSDYLTQQVYSCSNSLDIVRLKAAWVSVVEANPILRTTIVFANSGHSHLNGLQVVLGKESIDWQEVNVANGQVVDQALQEVLEADRNRGIEAGKLLTRFTVLQGVNGISHFIWTIHHALYDGWSMDLLFNDLATAYQGQQS